MKLRGGEAGGGVRKTYKKIIIFNIKLQTMTRTRRSKPQRSLQPLGKDYGLNESIPAEVAEEAERRERTRIQVCH